MKFNQFLLLTTAVSLGCAISSLTQAKVETKPSAIISKPVKCVDFLSQSPTQSGEWVNYLFVSSQPITMDIAYTEMMNVGAVNEASEFSWINPQKCAGIISSKKKKYEKIYYHNTVMINKPNDPKYCTTILHRTLADDWREVLVVSKKPISMNQAIRFMKDKHGMMEQVDFGEGNFTPTQCAELIRKGDSQYIYGNTYYMP